MKPLEYLQEKFKLNPEDIEPEYSCALPVDPSPMSKFERDSNCCTPVAVFKILKYLRTKGMKQIPCDEELWQLVYDKALELGYTAQKGIGVTKNDNLLRSLLKSCFGLSEARVKSLYFALIKPGRVKKELDAGHPVLLSMASGKYYNHTVLVMGYSIYKNKSNNKRYTFLLLTDGWSPEPCFFPWTHTGEMHIGCLTAYRL